MSTLRKYRNVYEFDLQKTSIVKVLSHGDSQIAIHIPD